MRDSIFAITRQRGSGPLTFAINVRVRIGSSLIPNTKWQDLQSLLLSSFTSCGVSFLKVRMNNNQWKVLAILWVIFGKPNTTRFHIQTIKIRWNTTSPPGRSVFRIPQYRMNLHPNTANEYLNIYSYTYMIRVYGKLTWFLVFRTHLQNKRKMVVLRETFWRAIWFAKTGKILRWKLFQLQNFLKTYTVIWYDLFWSRGICYLHGLMAVQYCLPRAKCAFT